MPAIDRQTLYEEVWSEPVTTVAARYGLSDVGLAKICRSLAIPLPSRGYWAKIKAGKIMAKAPLPKIPQTSQKVTGLVKLSPEKIASYTAAKKTHAKVRQEVIARTTEELSPSTPHILVQAASKRLKRRDGWPSDTATRSAPKEILNICVSLGTLDRALDISDRLLKILEGYGFEFEIDNSRQETLLRKVETDTRLPFKLTEHIQRSNHIPTPNEERARKKYWEHSRFDRTLNFPIIPKYDYTPTGILTVEVGRWPQKTWKDTPRKNLEQRIDEVIAGILSVAHDTYEREQEQARREEARRLAISRYEFLKKRRLDEAERFKALDTSANNWERAAKLRAFADAVEANAKISSALTADQVEWLAWARAKADWLDPLIQVSDPILDAPEPKQPGYY